MNEYDRKIREFFSSGEIKEMELTVEGKSMAKFLLPGNKIFIKKVSPSALSVGDVVVFFARDSNTPVVHRLIWKTKRNGKTRFYTKGDANVYAEHFAEDHYLGRVEKIFKNGKPTRQSAFLNKLRGLAGFCSYGARKIFRARV